VDYHATKGRLDLRASFGDIRNVEVRDLRGSRVAGIPGQGSRSLSIPTAGWAPGVYQLRIQGDAATAYRKVAIP
jgi:hypothetical protein